MIERLVRTLLRRARLDPLIGPIFENKVHDWEGHLGRMCAFWSSVALDERHYHGQADGGSPAATDRHAAFDRWLEIFTETARDVCPRQRRPTSWSAPIASPRAWSSALPPKKGRSDQGG